MTFQRLIRLAIRKEVKKTAISAKFKAIQKATSPETNPAMILASGDEKQSTTGKVMRPAAIGEKK